MRRDIGWNISSPTTWPYQREPAPARVRRPGTRINVLMEAKRIVIDGLYQQVGEGCCPEQHILIAIIDQAIYDAMIATIKTTRARMLKADAEAFLRGEYFEWMLEQLGVEKSWFDGQLAKIKACSKILNHTAAELASDKSLRQGGLI